MATQRLQGRNVLIVDDDQDILASIDLAMRAEGAATTKVTDGNTAVSAWHAGRPDAVVLDMMLPKRSGFLVLEKIMEEPDPPVVVMVTANQGKRHQAYAHTLGVHAYMTKPVSLQRLVETIARLLEGKPLKQRVMAPVTPLGVQTGVRPTVADDAVDEDELEDESDDDALDLDEDEDDIDNVEVDDKGEDDAADGDEEDEDDLT